MTMSVFCVTLLVSACLADAALLMRRASLNFEDYAYDLKPEPHSSFAHNFKPEPLLSFQAFVQTASGATQDVISDGERLMIASNELPSNQGMYGASNLDLPQDGSVLDFANALQFDRVRFFSDTVCIMINMRNVEPGAPYLPFVFRTTVGQMLGAPLDLYDMAEEFGGKLDLEGPEARSCYLWTNRSVSEFELPTLGELPEFQLAKMGVSPQKVDSLLSAVEESLDAGRLGTVSFATNATFCISGKGEILATSLSSLLTLEQKSTSNQSNNSNSSSSNQRVVLWENIEHTNMTFRKEATPNPVAFNATHGVSGGRCVDLTSGDVGPSELQSLVNSDERLARINVEAGGHWEAEEYDIWKNTTVAQTMRGLGTEIGPLKLPLQQQHHYHSHGPDGAFLFRSAKRSELPPHFDARAHWPDCPSISTVRNQGICGSCWAFAAVTVLADRFCIATKPQYGPWVDKASLMDITVNTSIAETVQSLHLAPEHLVDCDGSNFGCSGGRLDNVWWYLRDHGVPTESCRPYRYCPNPKHQHCGYNQSENPHPESPLVAAANPADTTTNTEGSSSAKCTTTCEGPEQHTPMHLYQVSAAYAVSKPSDVAGLQRELLTNGPVEVAMYVFSDFHSYRRGVYFRTPGAFGPLGGHAVKLVGWGWLGLDYWLAANSWSYGWGIGGFFKIRRGTNECGIETTPAAGIPMLGDSFGKVTHQHSL